MGGTMVPAHAPTRQAGAVEPKTVTLSAEFWDRVNMALDIAQFACVRYGTPIAERQYKDVQKEIERQVEGRTEESEHWSNRPTDS